MTTNHAADQQETMRVSTIELFFDLVFVFTITQITHLVEHAHSPLDFLLALVVLMIIWWMYAAYAWLTNAVGDQRPMRPILIAAMAGFLIIALSLPGVFGEDGLAFGLAYLFVVLIHLVAFLFRGGPNAGRAILSVVPYNLGAAGLVIAAGLLDVRWDWFLFIAAASLFVIPTIFRGERGFAVNSAYFVERHGLIIILALGESVIAVGTGAADRRFDLQTILSIILSLVFLATIWWSYFDRDDQRAEHAMNAASPEMRARMALLGYGFTHLVMIFGIVLIATGLKGIMAYSEEPIARAVWLLSSGMATYLLGDVLFRWGIGIGSLSVRAVGIVVAFFLGLVGLWWGGVAELSALTAMMVLILLIEQRLEREGRNEHQLSNHATE